MERALLNKSVVIYDAHGREAWVVLPPEDSPIVRVK